MGEEMMIGDLGYGDVINIFAIACFAASGGCLIYLVLMRRYDLALFWGRVVRSICGPFAWLRRSVDAIRTFDLAHHVALRSANVGAIVSSHYAAIAVRNYCVRVVDHGDHISVQHTCDPRYGWVTAHVLFKDRDYFHYSDAVRRKVPCTVDQVASHRADDLMRQSMAMLADVIDRG